MSDTEKRITREAVEHLISASKMAYFAVGEIDSAAGSMWAHVDGEARLDGMEADVLTQKLERISHELYRLQYELAALSLEVWP